MFRTVCQACAHGLCVLPHFLRGTLELLWEAVLAPLVRLSQSRLDALAGSSRSWCRSWCKTLGLSQDPRDSSFIHLGWCLKRHTHKSSTQAALLSIPLILKCWRSSLYEDLLNQTIADTESSQPRLWTSASMCVRVYMGVLGSVFLNRILSLIPVQVVDDSEVVLLKENHIRYKWKNHYMYACCLHIDPYLFCFL